MIAEVPAPTAEETANAAWDAYAAAIEGFRDIVQAHAGRHAMLRQHEKVIRTETAWKRAYDALLAPIGRVA